MSRFRTWYYGQPRAIRTLLAINVVAYLLWNFVLTHFEPTALFVYRHVALNPNLPGILYEPWQVLTYSFLHLSPGFGGLLHILFNMLWMMWIGREYEQMEGPRKMLALYVLGGVGGGVVTVILHGLFPAFGPFGGIVHGASGSVLGIMAGIALQYPQKTIALLFIGVVRLIHVVFGFVFLDFLFLSAGGTSVSAHLGGVLAGFIWAKAALAGIDLSGWAAVFYPKGDFSGKEGILHRLEAVFDRNKGDGKKTATQTRMTRVPTSDSDTETSYSAPAKSRGEKDVDAILDKISERGYDSLTAEEKKTLYEASQDE